jgi:PKD repeat protein
MKSNNGGVFSRIGKKQLNMGTVILLMLLLGAGSCSAAVSPFFTGMNQANMSLDDSDSIAFGDFLFLSDNSSIPAGEEVLERNWTVNGTDYYQNIKNVTHPVFGPFVNASPVFANLTITNMTGTNSSFLRVYHVTDGRLWISANYSYDAKYDNRTTTHPCGTITFFDTSIAKLFPEANITDWWWRWTNRTGLISGNFSGGDSFTLPMNPWLDTYTVNLTVKNNQGNLVSMNGTTPVPPDNVHPVANFTVTPVAGYAPLNISVIDQSRSMANYTMTDIALSYQYRVSNTTSQDVFGRTFTSQNLNLTLENPGVYNISQNVTNVFGVSDLYTFEHIVVYPPPPPEADFTASPRSGTGPLDVVFTSLVDGTGPFTYEWDFGDVSPIGYDAHPVHTYQDAGVYNVTLEVTGEGGSTLVNKTRYVAVSSTPPPDADFAVAPSNGTAPLSVSFIGLANGTGLLLYTWDFGDGIGNATGRNPVYTYPDAGLFNVTCTVSDGTKTGQVTRENCIRVLKQPDPTMPQAMFAASPRNGTAPLEVAFIDQSSGTNLTHLWDFGDSTPTSVLKNPVHTYEIPGTYDVRLLVHDANGDSLLNNTGFITVQSPALPEADFAATPLSGTAPLAVSFISQATGTEPLSHSWNFGDTNTSYDKNPVHTYTIAGNYTVNLTVTDASGTSTAEKSGLITVSPLLPPDVDFTASPRSGTGPLDVVFTSLVSGTGPFTYEWDFGDVSPIGHDPHPVHTYQDTGVYTVTLEVTGADGSTLVNKTGYIAVSTTPPPLADFAVAPSNGTAPLPVSFIGLANGTGSLLYTWDFGDGIGNATGRNPSYTYQTPGLYNVTCMVSDGVRTGEVSRENCIRVLDPGTGILRAMFTAAPRNGTAPLEVSFIDQSYTPEETVTYNWDFGDGSVIDHAQNPVHVYGNPGLYNVTLEVNDSSHSDLIYQNDFISVHEASLHEVDFTAVPPRGPAPLRVSFVDQTVGTGLFTYSWNFGDNTSNSFDRNPIHTYLNPGLYTVNLTVNGSAGSVTAVKQNLINASEIPFNASCSASPMSGFVPLTVSFIDLTTPVSSSYAYAWEFGDGESDVVKKNPVHEYNRTGNYTVNLTVTDAWGVSDRTSIGPIAVTNLSLTPTNESLVADFSASQVQGSAPLEVHFIDLSTGDPIAWKWYFDAEETGEPASWFFDKRSISSEQSPIHKYMRPGQYNVRLDVSNRTSSGTTTKKLFIDIDKYSIQN